MTFDCEAYGPEGREHGALCFIADERVCATETECAYAMAAERVRIFNRLNELRDAGNPIGVEMAQHFTSADQLLNGPEASA
jgi:hypothetical protein